MDVPQTLSATTSLDFPCVKKEIYFFSSASLASRISNSDSNSSRACHFWLSAEFIACVKHVTLPLTNSLDFTVFLPSFSATGTAWFCDCLVT